MINKFKSSDVNIWFTSDTHYWHKNMTAGVSSWTNPAENCRDFATTKEMSQHIVDQINKYVGEDDILFHLGDWSFGGIENVWNFRKQIKCKNIHLTYGNHDNHILNNKTLPNCSWSLEKTNYIEDFPNTITDTRGEKEYMFDVRAKQLFASTQQYLEIEIDGYKVCAMHYPIEEWNDRPKTSIMLHGHQHAKNTFKEFRLDVGMDKAVRVLREYKPFSWNEILQILIL